jgi:polyhydroxybutyrate depolymerase
MSNRILALGLLIVATTLAGPSLASWSYQGPFELLTDMSRQPAKVYLPSQYEARVTSKKWPLIMLLHGWGATGDLQDYYFGLSSKINLRQFIMLVPEGRVDSKGKQFWNASTACCDYDHSGTDDLTYLTNLVQNAKLRYNVDPARIYIVGHSNGGFMAHRLACASGLFAGIISFAGAIDEDTSSCQPPVPVSVLQIHAEDDRTVSYKGGEFERMSYPGAQATVSHWRERNNCDPKYELAGPFSLVRFVGGDDTTMQTWSHCRGNSKVALWTIKPSTSYLHDLHDPHKPWLTDEMIERMLGFFKLGGGGGD